MAKWEYDATEAGPQKMATAPKDGTRVLAYWPPVFDDTENGGWVTTWWGTNAGGKSFWESPWEYANESSAPTHWIQHPDAPRAG